MCKTRTCQYLISLVLGLGFALWETISDWSLLHKRTHEVDEIAQFCNDTDGSVEKQTDKILKALNGFTIIGTAFLVISTADVLYIIYAKVSDHVGEHCKCLHDYFECCFTKNSSLVDAKILCALIFVVEELPSAVLRWCLKTYIGKPTDFIGWADGILGLVSPFRKVLCQPFKCFCSCDSCTNHIERIPKVTLQGTPRCEMLIIGIIIAVGTATLILNVLNWVNVAAPNILTCQ